MSGPATSERQSGAEPPAPRAVGRLYRGLLTLLAVLANGALLFLVLVVLVAVLVRYTGVLPASLHWTAELARFTIIWVVMLGSVIAMDRGAHLAIDVTGMLPPGWRRPVRSLAYLLGLAFLAVLAWQGYVLAMRTMLQTTPALGLPMGFAYLAIPVGATLLLLQSVLLALLPQLAGVEAGAADSDPKLNA